MLNPYRKDSRLHGVAWEGQGGAWGANKISETHFIYKLKKEMPASLQEDKNICFSMQLLARSSGEILQLQSKSHL